MRIYLLFLLLFLPCYAFCIDKIEETSIILKHRLAKDVIPYLIPHLAEDGRISGQEKNITIRSQISNIDELMVIIGDLDRSDYMQLIISITMNIQTVHNLNTRSIQVGTNSWTKINYGITYSKRVREILANGHEVEKIKYIKVIESFQIHTEINESNKNLILKVRATQNEPTSDDNDLALKTIEVDELSENDLQIEIKGKLNEWVRLGDAINALYFGSDENSKITHERQQLTNNMGIKVQLLQ